MMASIMATNSTVALSFFLEKLCREFTQTTACPLEDSQFLDIQSGVFEFPVATTAACGLVLANLLPLRPAASRSWSLAFSTICLASLAGLVKYVTRGVYPSSASVEMLTTTHTSLTTLATFAFPALGFGALYSFPSPQARSLQSSIVLVGAATAAFVVAGVSPSNPQPHSTLLSH